MADVKVTVQESESRQFLPPCRVCGDRAAGFHYGVNTCEACKGFFHRSLRRHKEYKCRANRTSGYCEYKPGKRKSCQFCRYQRCLNAGMSKDAIKTGRYTYLKRTEDTQELKRLQEKTHSVGSCTDERDKEAMLVSSSSNEMMPEKSNSAELSRERSDTFMEVDSTTADDFLASSATEGDFTCSSSDLSNSEKSLIFVQSVTNLSPKKTLIYTEFSGNQAELPSSDHVTCTNQSMRSSKMVVSESIDPMSENCSNFNLQCTPQSNVKICLNKDNFSPGGSKNLLNSCNQNRLHGGSVIYRLLPDPVNEKPTESAQNVHIDSVKLSFNAENSNSSKDSSPEFGCASRSMHSLSKDENSFSSYGSPLSTKLCVKKVSGNVDLAEQTCDLFPDISYCLDNQPLTSPRSLVSEETESNSAITSSGLLSSVMSQSPDNNFVSPSASPGLIVLNMGSGKPLKLGDEYNLEPSLCSTPESRYPVQEEIMVYNEENITMQIMEEYTQGLDLIRDSPAQIKNVTPVQSLLTSPNPQEELKTVSPLSSDEEHLNEPSPISKLMIRVKNVQLSDITELYADMDSVINVLMASHQRNIGDFSYISKAEMAAQQKAHYESCQLKKQTFGDLGFLPEQEYDDIYSITGIDVDNRRQILQKYMSRVEKCVRGLVQFAKAIPGFSILDINTQVELIKLARSEIAIFTVYPTVNLELGVAISLTGEQWACRYDLGKIGCHLGIEEFMIFCDKLQKIAPSQEELVLLKAILVVSTDRDSSVKSPLAEAIRWHLILCLKHSLEKNRAQPSLMLARYILTLTQSRTVAEKFKDFLRDLKMRKYSSIEQNPLMWELFSGIFQEKEKEENWDKLCQLVGEGQAGIWSPCLLGDPVTI